MNTSPARLTLFQETTDVFPPIANRLGSAIIGSIGPALPEEKWEEIHEFINTLNPLDEEALTFFPHPSGRSLRVSTLPALNFEKE